MTDRNNDPLVSAILDIIDEKHSRYAVAVAIAEYVRGLQGTAHREGIETGIKRATGGYSWSVQDIMVDNIYHDELEAARPKLTLPDLANPTMSPEADAAVLHADLMWCIGKLRGLGYPAEVLETKYGVNE